MAQKLTQTLDEVQAILNKTTADLTRQIREVTGNYQVLITDETVVVDATTATITFPLISEAYDSDLEVGQKLVIKKKEGTLKGIIHQVSSDAATFDGEVENNEIELETESIGWQATSNGWISIEF